MHERVNKISVVTVYHCKHLPNYAQYIIQAFIKISACLFSAYFST